MRKLIVFVLAVLMLISAGTPALATDTEETDYMCAMLAAAAAGDWETGQYAQFARDKKINEESLDFKKISYEDLYLLAKIIYAEAGSQWLPDEWKLCVGEVVLNRVESPEFPNTVAEVVYQPGQYYGAGSSYFVNLNPDMRCVKLALRLLEGERVMDRPSVVFQANFRQGSGVYRSYCDEVLGWTYFCDSSRTHLYEI